MVLKIFTDGASRGNPGRSASAFIVLKEGSEIHQESEFIADPTTNNVAEYNAVLMAARWLRMKVRKGKVDFYTDSKLVANQLTGSWNIKHEDMINFVSKIKGYLTDFQWTITYIPRSKNGRADRLCNLALDSQHSTGSTALIMNDDIDEEIKTLYQFETITLPFFVWSSIINACEQKLPRIKGTEGYKILKEGVKEIRKICMVD